MRLNVNPSPAQNLASGHGPGPLRGSAHSLLLIALLLAGCQSTQKPVFPTTIPSTAPTGLSQPFASEDLQAIPCPPLGWRPDPLKSSERHLHQVWISPSGNTAYGVIRMKLPWPVGTNLVLWGFMNEMKRSEGEGTLLSKVEDDTLPGLRFVAEGGRYTVRTNLVTRGWTAWAVYAGTLRHQPVNEDELYLAELARENTILGLPKRPTEPPRAPQPATHTLPRISNLEFEI